eukprot:scaffold108519_cov78-Phaeocystis_antarctica.AAC.3
MFDLRGPPGRDMAAFTRAGSKAGRDGKHGPVHHRVGRHVSRQSIVLNGVESSPAQPLGASRPAPLLRSLTLVNPPARPDSPRVRVLPAAPLVVSDHGNVVVEGIPAPWRLDV